MSGGHFDYIDSHCKDEIFGWTDEPKNVFEDREISELIWDVFELIHEFDWYKSSDTNKEDYLKAKAEFKKKWLKNSGVRVRRIVDEAIAECKTELYETYGLSDRKTEPQYDFGAYADRLWKIAYERGKREALEQTEPTISKMEQVEDEPMTDCGDFADRLAYERGVKHAWEVAQKVFDSTVTFYEAEDVAKQIDKDINVRSKDKPKTQTETQNSNLTFEKADEAQTERSER